MLVGLVRSSDAAAAKSTQYVGKKSDHYPLIEGEEEERVPETGRSLIQERIANLRRTSRSKGLDSETLQVVKIKC